MNCKFGELKCLLCDDYEKCQKMSEDFRTKFTPEELKDYFVITDKLLANWDKASGVLSELLKAALKESLEKGGIGKHIFFKGEEEGGFGWN